MSAFASNNELLTQQLYEDTLTISGAGDSSCFGPFFMAGFKDVDCMVDESDRGLVFEADERHTMQCMDPTAPLYCEPDPAPLENFSWLGPVCAADKCQAMEGADSNREKPPQSSTIKTRTAAGPRNVDLNLPVLLAFKGLTLEQTAKQLGVSPTALKTHLRILGIEDWRDFRKGACMHFAHVAHQAV